MQFLLELSVGRIPSFIRVFTMHVATSSFLLLVSNIQMVTNAEFIYSLSFKHQSSVLHSQWWGYHSHEIRRHGPTSWNIGRGNFCDLTLETGLNRTDNLRPTVLFINAILFLHEILILYYINGPCWCILFPYIVMVDQVKLYGIYVSYNHAHYKDKLK